MCFFNQRKCVVKEDENILNGLYKNSRVFIKKEKEKNYDFEETDWSIKSSWCPNFE